MNCKKCGSEIDDNAVFCKKCGTLVKLKFALLICLLFIIVSISIIGCDKIIDTNNTPDTPEAVWGELIKHEGGYVWDTLTDAQQALVNYPKLNENCVYWAPNGKSYHSIEWCYTLTKSNDIRSGTLEEAAVQGKTDPCSKCVAN